MNTNTNNLVDVSNCVEIVADAPVAPQVNLWDNLLAQVNELRAAAAKPADSWKPYFKNVTFTRPVFAVIEDSKEAFEFRASQAALSSGQAVCARECRIAPAADAATAWFIY